MNTLWKAQMTPCHADWQEACMDETDRILSAYRHDFWGDCNPYFDMDCAYYMGNEL